MTRRLMGLKHLSLGVSLIYRERKATPIRALLGVLFLATFFLTIIAHVNEHAWQTVYDNAATTLGAQSIISSSEPLPASLRDEVERLNLNYLEIQSTLTMAGFEDKFQLTSLKAVGLSYPLMGETIVEQANQNRISVDKAPLEGSIWVERRFLLQMGAKIGDPIQIGDKQYTISGMIVKESDAANGLLLLAPRIIMNLKDLKDAGIIAPGSRATFSYWLAGERGFLNQIGEWVSRSTDPNITIEYATQGTSPLQKVVQYASRYLGLILVLTVVLAGISISLSTRFWVKERLSTFGIYRVLGASPWMMVRLLMGGLVFWGGCFIVLSVLLGIGATALIAHLGQSIFPSNGYMWTLAPTVMSLGIALFLLVGFTLPEMLLTGRMSPLTILKGHDLKLPALWWIYSLVTLMCCGLLYGYIQNASLTLILIAGFGWGGFLSYLSLLAFIYLLTKWSSKNLAVKCAVAQLRYRASEGAAQVLCLTLAFMTMFILHGIQQGFLSQWQASLPEKTPNHFLINIPMEEVTAIQSLIKTYTNEPFVVYPMIRGRVTHVKGEPITEWKGRLPNGLNRSLNITWAESLPTDNQILKGQNWSPDLRDKPLISIEEGFARRIGVQIGDTLDFLISGQKIQGEIYNIREVSWQSFKPNFFIIFPPGNLESLPATAMTSFYVDDTKDELAVNLGQNFPEVTVFDIAQLLEDVQKILYVLVQVLSGLVGLVILFAFIILYVILMSSKRQRYQDASLIRLIGGSEKLIRKITLIEFVFVGFITILLAALGSTWILNELSSRLFDLQYHVSWLQLGWMGAVAFVGLTGFGYFILYDVSKQSPLRVIREASS